RRRRAQARVREAQGQARRRRIVLGRAQARPAGRAAPHRRGHLAHRRRHPRHIASAARAVPPAPVVLYPTAVQGAAAVPEIVRAIETAARRAECDVLIVARGGGSLEDLWCFNDERVARAIGHCRIPTVSGVGHEVDVTIADFVADLRAPTPSAAALAVTPDRAAWLETLALLLTRFGGAMGRYLRGQHLQLGGCVQ